MPQPAGKLPFNMQHLMRAMGIMTVPISLTMPAGVLVYWTTSNVVGMLQRVFMDSVAVRRALDIPLVSDLPHSRQVLYGFFSSLFGACGMISCLVSCRRTCIDSHTQYIQYSSS